MNAEIIAIVTVGVALAGVILTSARGVRQNINELRGEVNELRGEVGDTPRTNGAPGRADGRIARSDRRPGQGQLGQAFVGVRTLFTMTRRTILG